MEKGKFNLLLSGAREYVAGRSYKKGDIIVTPDRKKLLIAETDFVATDVTADIANGKITPIVDREALEKEIIAYATIF